MNTGATLYIGCTSVPLESRLSDHRSCSKNGITILYQHIRRNKIIIGIRELDSIKCKGHTKALALEEKWIKKLTSEGVKVFNHRHTIGKVNPIVVRNRAKRKLIDAKS